MTYCLEGLDSTIHLKTIYPSHYQKGKAFEPPSLFFISSTFNTVCFLSGSGHFKLQVQQKIVIVLSEICALSGPKRTSSLYALTRSECNICCEATFVLNIYVTVSLNNNNKKKEPCIFVEVSAYECNNAEFPPEMDSLQACRLYMSKIWVRLVHLSKTRE